MKPIKGVIDNWEVDGEVIIGTCVFHDDAVSLSEGFHTGGVVHDAAMHTSAILGIVDCGPCKIATTRNSRYILLQSRADKLAAMDAAKLKEQR